MFLLSPLSQRHLRLKAKPPNARINPAGRIVSSIQVLRMTIKLHRLGLNELLGSANDLTIQAAIRFFSPAPGST